MKGITATRVKLLPNACKKGNMNLEPSSALKNLDIFPAFLNHHNYQLKLKDTLSSLTTIPCTLSSVTNNVEQLNNL